MTWTEIAPHPWHVIANASLKHCCQPNCTVKAEMEQFRTVVVMASNTDVARWTMFRPCRLCELACSALTETIKAVTRRIPCYPLLVILVRDRPRVTVANDVPKDYAQSCGCCATVPVLPAQIATCPAIWTQFI